MPTSRRNVLVKWLWSANPASNAITASRSSARGRPVGSQLEVRGGLEGGPAGRSAPQGVEAGQGGDGLGRGHEDGRGDCDGEASTARVRDPVAVHFVGRVKDEGRGSAPHANPTPVFHVPDLDGEAETRPRVRLQWNLLRWIVDRVAQPKARDVERSERLPEVARPRSRRASPRPW